MYECGHSICELCMYEIDARDSSDDTHTARIHHCPICRSPTLRGWKNRPISVTLEIISSTHPCYEERKREAVEARLTRGDILCIPDFVDLARISYTARLKLALDMYEVVVERLYAAAKDGLSHLIIKDKAIVAAVEKVADILAIQLFTRHNVYRVLVTKFECTIYITKDAFDLRRQYQNTDWNDPGPTIEDRGERWTILSHPLCAHQEERSNDSDAPMCDDSTTTSVAHDSNAYTQKTDDGQNP